MKSLYLSRYFVELNAFLPEDITTASVLPYFCLFDYVQRSKETSFFSEYVNFLNTNRNATEDEITNFVAIGKERLESRYNCFESPAVLFRRNSNSDIKDVGTKSTIRRMSF